MDTCEPGQVRKEAAVSRRVHVPEECLTRAGIRNACWTAWIEGRCTVLTKQSNVWSPTLREEVFRAFFFIFSIEKLFAFPHGRPRMSSGGFLLPGRKRYCIMERRNNGRGRPERKPAS
ncbi:hypothetical protein BN871_KK_00040 [Paenibacillus sp. P22]|nr:hypothetical protein BN871_KK_00040 [Paenibacillus sp. P22]